MINISSIYAPNSHGNIVNLSLEGTLYDYTFLSEIHKYCCPVKAFH